MRPSLRSSALLFAALTFAAVACGRDAVLSGQAGTAGAGTGSAGAAGTQGQGGDAGQGVDAGADSSTMPVCGSPLPASEFSECIPGAYKRAGVCECQDLAPCVCPAVGCVDPMTDPDNCGACGHRCGPTSVCNEGACGPAPVTVVPALPGCGSIDVAVRDGTVYWANKGLGQIHSVTAEGLLKNMANGESGPTRIAVAGTSVFWLDATINTLRRSVAGGAPSTVFASPTPIHGFVATADGESVYFSSEETISRVPATGGAPVVVVREERNVGFPTTLALTSTGNAIAYLTEHALEVMVVTLVPGQVARCANVTEGIGLVVPGVDCAFLAQASDSLFVEAIAVANDHVIWADGLAIDFKPLPAIPHTVLDLVATSPGDVSGMAVSMSTVTFAAKRDDDGKGAVFEVPLAKNQTAVRLARGQNGPRSLAMDGTKVYWSTADCTIESTGL